MNFDNLIRKKNILLLPFSWLYKTGVWVYHKLYDFKIVPSYQPPVKTICVGNLSVGGTGKSPMVEYLLHLLVNAGQETFSPQVAVVSRGYKRKSKGLVVADAQSTTSDIGDEPMQFHQKFPQVKIVVHEQRAKGIEIIFKQFPEINVIILDDAFQHRAVTAEFNILLTEYQNIFTEDWYLPAGTLRDLKSNYKRANIIVVTKCDIALAEAEKQRIIESIQPQPYQKVFFTTFDYGIAYQIFDKQTISLSNVKGVVLITGIANPQPIIDYLGQYECTVEHLQFADHHHFSTNDIGDILGTYQALNTENKIILTTEKDAVRLADFSELRDFPVYALPIRHRFLFDEGGIFDEWVLRYVGR